MRKQIFLIASVMLFSTLIVGCNDSAKTVQDVKKEKSQAVKEVKERVKEEPTETTPDNEEGKGFDESNARFNEAKRKIIFSAVAEASRRADRETEERFPTAHGPNTTDKNILPRLELGRRLEEKYTAEVRAKYEISKDEQLAIVNEGIINSWPLPEPSMP